MNASEEPTMGDVLSAAAEHGWAGGAEFAGCDMFSARLDLHGRRLVASNFVCSRRDASTISHRRFVSDLVSIGGRTGAVPTLHVPVGDARLLAAADECGMSVYGRSAEGELMLAPLRKRRPDTAA